MITRRAFLRFFFTAAPALAIVQALSGLYLLGLYCLMLAPIAFMLAPYVCDE
jgi:hypothetical protein